MASAIELLPRAEKELEHAQGWYETRREGLGGRFLDEVEAMLARISTGPQRFPRWMDDARYQRAVLSRFPYMVMFIANTPRRTVTVVAIAHTSRKPGYWK
ncbi:MAG TPA: type II toxin-antitoxin system RelE/ParE family toxin [Kofleriaceae bacterium]|nr:type II toxin-antitoxin system RelE/ParE family toxin [Kofleriaceae bacterium]